MNRELAMDKAVQIVDEWTQPPMKSNGYVADGWKPPTLAEKVDAAEKLASFLWDADDMEVTDASRTDEPSRS